MRLYGLIFFAVAFLVSSCGGGSDLPSHGGSGSSIIGGGGPGPTGQPAVTVAASPASIPVNGTSTITATVLDSSGALVPDGTAVSFSLSPAGIGTIDTPTANTSSGIATVIYTAPTTPGSVTVTATFGSTSNTDTITISTQAATVTLTAAPTSLTVLGTSSLSATVLDTTGANMPDGTVVTFALSAPVMGTINAQANTSSGIATVAFTASTIPGTVTVTATSGSISNTALITITAPATGSIQFTSATPQVLGLKGVGQTETSLVQFAVSDINGNPVIDGTNVSFVMSGPGGARLPADGGEYIGNLDATPTTASTSTLGGVASVILHSGTLSGPVTIVATVSVSGTDISSSSGVISIGGGVPSSKHFSLATTILNLPGYTTRNSSGFVNEQATVSAFIADRFGNYNVLEGTSISFYTEAGAIDNSAITDDSGAASVVFRTQQPMPSDVAADAFETGLLTSINTAFGISTPFHPRDGRVTVLATVMGEEGFDDASANGIYDPGESFDDIGEPFYDKNDDGCRNTGTQAICEPPTGTIASTDPFEEFIDANGNGIFDTANGCWDGPNPNPAYTCAGREDSKMLFKRLNLTFSGDPKHVRIVCDITDSDCITPKSFSVANAEILRFDVIVGDVNLNVPVADTSVLVFTSSSSGSFDLTDLDFVFADQVSSSPYLGSVFLSDSVPSGGSPTGVLIELKVVWEGIEYTDNIFGFIN